MKMTKEHFAILKNAIEQWDSEKLRVRYLNGDYHNAEKTKDVNRRYRWDMFWLACANIPELVKIKYALWDYLNDNHIDTALRRIVAPL